MLLFLVSAIAILEFGLLMFYGLRMYRTKPTEKVMYDGIIRYGSEHEHFYSHPSLYPQCLYGARDDDKFILDAQCPGYGNVTATLRAYNGPNNDQLTRNWCYNTGQLGHLKCVLVKYADGTEQQFTR